MIFNSEWFGCISKQYIVHCPVTINKINEARFKYIFDLTKYKTVSGNIPNTATYCLKEKKSVESSITKIRKFKKCNLRNVQRRNYSQRTSNIKNDLISNESIEKSATCLLQPRKENFIRGYNKTEVTKRTTTDCQDSSTNQPNRYRNISGNLIPYPKVAACCFVLWYLTMLVWASPMPPRLRSQHVARYINFTKIMGKEPLPSTFLTTTELIAARSLTPEEHYIITEDGYILSLYRLYSKATMDPRRTPVLIMHGLMASSDSWLVGKRSTSLPIYLADLGYDVWLGDQRGNANSKRHVFLNPRGQKFWNFSFHESGYYDLPSFMDHVLARTGHKQLIYIGHSMATAAFLVMSSTKPQYNAKIKLSCLLAPVAYLKHVSELDFFMLQLFSQSNLIIHLLEQVGLYEIFPRSVTLMQLTKMFCGSTMTQPLCVFAIQFFLQQNPKNIDMERAGFIFSYVPAGSSLKMLEHFTYNLKSGRFQYFDYGRERNKEIYNSLHPPEYNLRKVTSPVALYYSLNDIFLNKRTVMKTANELPNLARIYEIPDKKYSHADFVLGLNSKDVLFKDLIKLMKKYE